MRDVDEPVCDEDQDVSVKPPTQSIAPCGIESAERVHE
jgi:hypothetical protein